jgi:hypothetical protein
MDALHARLDALEHQVHTLHQQAHATDRRLRWWRRLACGLVVLGLIGWTLQASTAPSGQVLSLPDRLEALEGKLASVTFNAATHELVITGANLHLRNGMGSTETTNGLGNLIVGYNESRQEENVRTGSHNVVVGQRHNFSRFGGVVVGQDNAISGDFASVSGGRFNTASSLGAVVSGGSVNTASGIDATVSGGRNRTAEGAFDWVAGSLVEDE